MTVEKEMIKPATQVTGASRVMATPMPAKMAMTTGRTRPVPTVGTRPTSVRTGGDHVTPHRDRSHTEDQRDDVGPPRSADVVT